VITVRTVVSGIVASAVWLGIACADEGVLVDGRRVEGTLGTDAQGQVLFQSRGEKLSLRLDQFDHVRFPAVRLPPLRAGAPFRIVLPGAQRLTGELVGLDSDKIHIHTAWSEKLSIPRAGVTAVGHAPGFVTLFVDDFEKDLRCWRVTGAPMLSTTQHVSGQRSLCLDTSGQQVEYTLPTPLTAGRVGINFRDRAQDGWIAWQFEADFGDSTAGSAVRVGIAPRTGDYTAEVSGATAAKSCRPRLLRAFKDGWQRLEMEYSPARLVVSIDDNILLSCRQPGSSGTLRKVRLSCTSSASVNRGRAGAFFDDLSVARAVADLPHPKGDPEQDELWLIGGDQLFGNLVSATAGTIQLRGAYGPRSLSWGEVRGIYFRRPATPTRKAGDKLVRVWLRPGIGLEPDVLNGTVRRLDSQCLVLDHALLGQVEIDRRRLHRMRALAEEPFENENRAP
jgi:hypothetical protein